MNVYKDNIMNTNLMWYRKKTVFSFIENATESMIRIFNFQQNERKSWQSLFFVEKKNKN